VTREKFEAQKRNVFEQVKASYFQLAYIQKTLGVLERDQTLLDQIERIATRVIAWGKGNQQDVLKAQLQKTKNPERTGASSRADGQPAALDGQALEPPAGGAQIAVDDIVETPLRYIIRRIARQGSHGKS